MVDAAKADAVVDNAAIGVSCEEGANFVVVGITLQDIQVPDKALTVDNLMHVEDGYGWGLIVTLGRGQEGVRSDLPRLVILFVIPEKIIQ